MSKPKKPVMTREHPQWEKFVERLQGPEGCDFKNDPERGLVWVCSNRPNRPLARKILKDMGCDVEASLTYFSSHGGHCDCEILFNVNRE